MGARDGRGRETVQEIEKQIQPNKEREREGGGGGGGIAADR